jgi:hypothetical protein
MNVSTWVAVMSSFFDDNLVVVKPDTHGKWSPVEMSAAALVKQWPKICHFPGQSPLIETAGSHLRWLSYSADTQDKARAICASIRKDFGAEPVVRFWARDKTWIIDLITKAPMERTAAVKWWRDYLTDRGLAETEELRDAWPCAKPWATPLPVTHQDFRDAQTLRSVAVTETDDLLTRIFDAAIDPDAITIAADTRGWNTNRRQLEIAASRRRERREERETSIRRWGNLIDADENPTLDVTTASIMATIMSRIDPGLTHQGVIRKARGSWRTFLDSHATGFDVRRHLERNTQPLGLIFPDETAAVCVDIDAHDDDFQRARDTAWTWYQALANKSQNKLPLISTSPGGGYHIWMFFTQAVDRESAAKILDANARALGLPVTGVDLFPFPMGRGVRLPLGPRQRLIDGVSWDGSHNIPFVDDAEYLTRVPAMFDAATIGPRDDASMEAMATSVSAWGDHLMGSLDDPRRGHDGSNKKGGNGPRRKVKANSRKVRDARACKVDQTEVGKTTTDQGGGDKGRGEEREEKDCYVDPFRGAPGAPGAPGCDGVGGENGGSQDMARETGTHLTGATAMAHGPERSDGKKKDERREGLLCGSLSGKPAKPLREVQSLPRDTHGQAWTSWCETAMVKGLVQHGSTGAWDTTRQLTSYLMLARGIDADTSEQMLMTWATQAFDDPTAIKAMIVKSIAHRETQVGRVHEVKAFRAGQELVPVGALGDGIISTLIGRIDFATLSDKPMRASTIKRLTTCATSILDALHAGETLTTKRLEAIDSGRVTVHRDGCTKRIAIAIAARDALIDAGVMLQTQKHRTGMWSARYGVDVPGVNAIRVEHGLRAVGETYESATDAPQAVVSKPAPETRETIDNSAAAILAALTAEKDFRERIGVTKGVIDSLIRTGSMGDAGTGIPSITSKWGHRLPDFRAIRRHRAVSGFPAVSVRGRASDLCDVSAEQMTAMWAA